MKDDKFIVKFSENYHDGFSYDDLIEISEEDSKRATNPKVEGNDLKFFLKDGRVLVCTYKDNSAAEAEKTNFLNCGKYGKYVVLNLISGFIDERYKGLPFSELYRIIIA